MSKRMMTLLLFVCSMYVFCDSTKIDTSRLRIVKEKTDQELIEIQNEHAAALERLDQAYQPCASRDEKEGKKVQQSPEYKFYYLPVAQKLGKCTWRSQYLNVVIAAAEENKSNESDIVKMQVALNKKLSDIMIDLAEEYKATAQNCWYEVTQEIALESRLLGIEEAKNSIPDYE